MHERARAWQNEALVTKYLEGIRAAVPLAGEQIEMMVRLLRASGIEVRRVLDLGCGDGVLTAVLLDEFPDARSVLVDFSEPMVTAARERLRPLGDRCAIHLADLSTPAWRDAMGGADGFDAAVSGYAIHHLTDERKRALYGEVLDLLAQGGFFINIEHVASPTPWLEYAFDELMIDSLLAFQTSKGTAPTREEVAQEYVYRPDKHENILSAVEEQCGWLRELGYEDVDCYFKVLELAVFGGRKAR